MPFRVALAGCSLWPGGSGDHAGLAEALADRGAGADWLSWEDPAADWSRYDLVLLRETWDYTAHLDRFLGWIDDVAVATRLVNPPGVVGWNHHKEYLRQLAGAGVPTVPTAVVRAGSGDAGAALAAFAGDAFVVVKPAVGIGGDGAVRGRADDPATADHVRALLAGGDVLVQPYVPSIETDGETSVVVLGGRVSHAVAKRPAAGEFRIHAHRGGTYAEVEASAAHREVALAAYEAARDATGDAILYARADLVAGDGGPLLMELELIEPSLYLHVVPSATAHLADLVVAAVRSR
ncbi:MAG TPA: hypothetical protein VHM89_06750 [Acidimicrobiales bacterium]|nr:hypothetical protein [Acidimicrobiales bacterium]